MVLSEVTKQHTIKEWRELGFFCDLDEDAKTWRFIGSLTGLRKFCNLLNEYTLDKKNETVSEHEHYGPYMYLKIMTLNYSGITGNCIHGNLTELKKLAELIDNKLEKAHPGSKIVIDSEYSDKADFSLLFEVMQNNFDPSNADPLII